MFAEVTTLQHIRTVSSLAREIWVEHYVPIIGNEQTEYMVNLFQSVEAIDRQIRNEDYIYFLIQQKDTAVGYLAIQPRKDDLFLSKIYIKQAMRGMGIGRKAIGLIEELAKDVDKPVITLTVNRYNSDSIAAYSRLGFRITGTVVTDIGGGFVMDDYVMQKEVPAAQ